jgi:hypothetical protein
MLQNGVMQHIFGISDEELKPLMEGENEKDPRLAKILEWVVNYAEPMSDALANTPEDEREELFATLYIDKNAAVERFLSAHPELRPSDETLH